MKKDIHPEWFTDTKVILDGEVVMTVSSTRPQLNIEVWSGTHPFYTGQQRLVDTEGQVDRFLKRLQRRQDISAELEAEEEKRSPDKMELSLMSLGKRPENALTEAGLVTIGDVLARLQEGDDGLLAIQGIGQKALIDIKRYLRGEGFIE